MAHPIPGFDVSTPYDTLGSWKCLNTTGTNGHHTGDDYTTSGQIGFKVHATRGGIVVFAIADESDNGWGESYGNHVVIESDGVQHGYCHLSEVFVGVGREIETGDLLGLSGNTGKVKGSVGPHLGAHLHYEERVDPFTYCEGRRKPELSRGPGPGTTIPVGKVLVSRLQFGTQDSNSVRRLQDVLNGLEMGRRIEVHGNYGRRTRNQVRVWQIQVVGEPPESPFAQGNLGPRQARKLLERTGNEVIDDTDDDPET